jgi:hypothetical protein
MAYVIGFILWLVLAFVVAAGAKNRGRSYGLFFMLSILLSPLISAFIMLVLGEKISIPGQQVNNTYSPSQRSINQTEKKCKSCGSIVSVDFRKCPNCGSYDFSDKNNSIDLSKVESISHIETDNATIICPHCSAKFKLSISIKDFKETNCIKCKKKITLKNVIFE